MASGLPDQASECRGSRGATGLREVLAAPLALHLQPSRQSPHYADLARYSYGLHSYGPLGKVLIMLIRPGLYLGRYLDWSILGKSHGRWVLERTNQYGSSGISCPTDTIHY